jgi:hypothetical protein
MLDDNNLMIIATWDTAQMTPIEIETALTEFSESARKVATLEHWNRELEEVFSE